MMSLPFWIIHLKSTIGIHLELDFKQQDLLIELGLKIYKHMHFFKQ
jgi:hypothetical protein